MSVGGVVTGIDKIPDMSRVRVRTRERDRPGDVEVCVELECSCQTDQIRIGDGFWWHDGYVRWTPMKTAVREVESRCDIGDRHVDIPIARVSNSYQWPDPKIKDNLDRRSRLLVRIVELVSDGDLDLKLLPTAYPSRVKEVMKDLAEEIENIKEEGKK